MEYVYSHDYKNGLKIMEHSYIGNDFMDIIEGLLSPTGSWYKCRLCWAGDYMDSGLFLPEGTPKKDKDGHDINLHSVAEKEIKPNALYLPKRGRYLVNHTKKVCLDLKAEKDNGETWAIHPLSLLTCSGNGRGGGDYRGSNMDIVGSWAGDVISLEHKPIYTLNKPINFVERSKDSKGKYKFVSNAEDYPKVEVPIEKDNIDINSLQHSELLD